MRPPSRSRSASATSCVCSNARACSITDPRFFAPASRGTEELLADELRELGIEPVEALRGGVAFGRELEHGYRACVGSRIASRVLMPLARFAADDANGFYDAVREVDWTRHLGPDTTLAVDTAGGNAPAGPPQFLALKAKDAIVDRIRDATGRRPDVDTRRAGVRIHLHLSERLVTVSLDLAGSGLHHRGLGRAGAVAPLRENLAASLLRMAGWPSDPASPLYDPMCGSATLLIEAAWMALDVAPGLRRPRFGAVGWRGHDPALWRRLLGEAESRQRAAAGRALRIAGSDASDEAVALARERVERARLAGRIAIERCELGRAEPPWSEAGLLVCNPPYGERLGEAAALVPLYEQLGDRLRRRFPGWTAWILGGNRGLERSIGLRPTSRRPVWNGPIECRWLEIPIHDAPVSSDDGPTWRRTAAESSPFEKKLRTNFRRLGKWARAEGTDCFRVYDSDIPEYNLAVDWYAGFVRVEEYPRPRKVDLQQADRRLREAMRVLPAALDVDPSRLALRVPGAVGEGESRASRVTIVEEAGLRFEVDLASGPGGLFRPGERLLRAWVRERASGLDVMHVFAGACSLTLAAAAGGARSTLGVDRSKRALDRGRSDFERNGLAGSGHRFVRADPGRDPLPRGRFGLILLSPPPTGDPSDLIRAAASRLAPGGTILFWTIDRRSGPDPEVAGAWRADDLSETLRPADFRHRAPFRAWRLARDEPGT